MKADLHIHSEFSDGSDSRTAILRKAAACGIDVLGFTEHDATESWQKSIEFGKNYDIKVLSGVEMSARDYRTGKKVHILRYLFDSGQNEKIFGHVHHHIFYGGRPGAFRIKYAAAELLKYNKRKIIRLA